MVTKFVTINMSNEQKLNLIELGKDIAVLQKRKRMSQSDIVYFLQQFYIENRK